MDTSHTSVQASVPEVAVGHTSRPDTRVKYVVEAIGTFFLVFTVGAVVGSRSPLAPLAIGAVLMVMVMVYAGGHLSGGNYNPAVTVAALVRRRIGLRDAAGYWLAHFGDSLVAATVVRAQAAKTTTLTPTGTGVLATFVVELLFTFALCYVVLNVATSKNHPNNSFYGRAIGFTVVAGAVAVGAISGGAFNPAVAVGAAGMGMFAWQTLWISGCADCRRRCRWSHLSRLKPRRSMSGPRSSAGRRAGPLLTTNLTVPRPI